MTCTCAAPSAMRSTTTASTRTSSAGWSSAIPTPLPNTMWGVPKDVKGYSFDIDKAKAELAQASVKVDKPIELAFLTGFQQSEQAAQLLQNGLTKAGLQSKVVGYPWPTIVDKFKDPNTTPDVSIYWISTYYADPHNWVGEMFSSSTAGTFKNAAHYKNPKVDALLDKALSLTDQAERAKLYEEATRIVVDEAAGLWIYNTKWYGPYSEQAQGHRLLPDRIGAGDAHRLLRGLKPGPMVMRLDPWRHAPRAAHGSSGRRADAVWLALLLPTRALHRYPGYDVMRIVALMLVRFAWLAPTLAGLVAIVFLISRVIPSDPVALLAGETASRAQIELLRQKLGLDRPLPVQLARLLPPADVRRPRHQPVHDAAGLGRSVRAIAGDHRADDRRHDRGGRLRHPARCGRCALPQSDRRSRAAHRHGRWTGGRELLAGADAAAVLRHGAALAAAAGSHQRISAAADHRLLRRRCLDGRQLQAARRRACPPDAPRASRSPFPRWRPSYASPAQACSRRCSAISSPISGRWVSPPA